MKDGFFRALASPYRRKIIRALGRKSMNVNEIVQLFEISQPSVSRHLDILKRAGLVTAERRSNQMIYSLNPDGLRNGYVYFSELTEDIGRETC